MSLIESWSAAVRVLLMFRVAWLESLKAGRAAGQVPADPLESLIVGVEPPHRLLEPGHPEVGRRAAGGRPDARLGVAKRGEGIAERLLLLVVVLDLVRVEAEILGGLLVRLPQDLLHERVRVNRAAGPLEIPDEAREPVRRPVPGGRHRLEPGNALSHGRSTFPTTPTLAPRSSTGLAAEASVVSATAPVTVAMRTVILSERAL
jgi:hypothetical protein